MGGDRWSVWCNSVICKPVLFFTGLSAAGKTTIANAVSAKLHEAKYMNCVVDGDIIRNGLCSDLGFSKVDRSENIRRVAELCNILSNSGLITISALIAPTTTDRLMAKAIIGQNFHEIYIKAPLTVCELRDPKGLYISARSGTIENFTGISDNYDVPQNPQLIIDTHKLTIAESVTLLYHYITGL
jgi:adenylylsulfate kinase